jgi:RNA polymerase sigma factor (sigma-70 family)
VLTQSRVYILDDDAAVRRAMSRLLQAAGFTVSAHGTTAEFLQVLRPEEPGCLLLDLRMPDGSGLDLLERLPSLAPLLSVVMLTGFGDVRSSVHAMKLGAIDFLTKPVSEESLIAAIGAAMERSDDRHRWRVELQAVHERLNLLTRREREVCTLVAQGLLNKQIAGQIGTSEKTVKVHRARVMSKLQVGSVAQLVRLVDRGRVGLAAKS